MSGRFRPVAAFAALVLSLVCATPASAGSLTISPLQIDLDGRARSQILTLTNSSDRPVEVLISGHRWAQDAGASQALVDAPELIVYPATLDLQPLESRPIRIALPQPDRSREGDYRILITELPPQDSRDGAMLRFQEQLSIPAFATVSNPTIALHVLGGRLAGGALAFELNNAGSAHAFVDRTDVELLDANAAVLARAAVNGWYVLPGARQTYRATVDAGVCSRVAQMRLHVHSRSGDDLIATIRPELSCARSS